MALLHDTRIRKRCGIITDLDEAFLDTAAAAGDTVAEAKFKVKCQGSEEAGAARKVDLDAFVAGNAWLSVQYAQHTFEVDSTAAGNAAEVALVVDSVYQQAATIATARAELTSGDKARYGRRVLTMASNQGKGWFAILLGKNITHKTVLPAYIWTAIFFARPTLTRELFFNIYSYRLRHAANDGIAPRGGSGACTSSPEQFREGAISPLPRSKRK